MHAVGTRGIDCISIAFRNFAVAIEESAVEIESQKTYRHEEEKVAFAE